MAEVRSESLPVFCQHPIVARDTLADANLSMFAFSVADEAGVVEPCRKLAAAYESWIDGLQAEAAGPGPQPRTSEDRRG